MDKNKTYLLEALCKKGLALCEMYQSSENFDESTTILEEIKNIFNDVVKFVEPSDLKVNSFSRSDDAIVGLTIFTFIKTGYQIFDSRGSSAKTSWESFTLGLQTVGRKTNTGT